MRRPSIKNSLIAAFSVVTLFTAIESVVLIKSMQDIRLNNENLVGNWLLSVASSKQINVSKRDLHIA